MRHTAFDTPIVKPLFTLLSRIGLRLRGWRIEGHKPSDEKYVLIAAPHTSNWDFLLMLAMAFVLDLKVYWMGKKSIFKPPFAGLMHWLGGVSVDRSKANNLVDQMAEHFARAERMVLVIPPEGTRSNTHSWKSGFYHIAKQSGVPIAMGFLDYAKKVGGIGPLFTPSGNLAKDEVLLQEFYATVTGCYPDKACKPKLQ